MVFSLSSLWWIRGLSYLIWRIRGLWELPDGRDWLWGKLGLVLMGVAMLSKSLTQFDSYMFYMIQLIPGFIMVVLVSQANCDGLLPSTLCTSIVQAENVRLESEHMLLKTCTLGKCPIITHLPHCFRVLICTLYTFLICVFIHNSNTSMFSHMRLIKS